MSTTTQTINIQLSEAKRYLKAVFTVKPVKRSSVVSNDHDLEKKSKRASLKTIKSSLKKFGEFVTTSSSTLIPSRANSVDVTNVGGIELPPVQTTPSIEHETPKLRKKLQKLRQALGKMFAKKKSLREKVETGEVVISAPAKVTSTKRTARVLEFLNPSRPFNVTVTKRTDRALKFVSEI